jgi:hypothetical protein
MREPLVYRRLQSISNLQSQSAIRNLNQQSPISIGNPQSMKSAITNRQSAIDYDPDLAFFTCASSIDSIFA